MLKKLVLVRHGDYDGAGNLSRGGREDVLLTAHKIKGLSGNESVRIISSPELRALQSAEVIAKIFEATVAKDNALTGNEPRYCYARILSIIESTHEGVLILVTHDSVVSSCPYIVEHLFGEKYVDLPHMAPCGGAIVIDCIVKTIQRTWMRETVIERR